MRKLIFSALVLAGALFLAAPARAQFTTVTATVTDPNGIPYGAGTVTAVLTPGSSSGFTLSGNPYSGRIGPAILDSNGSFTLNFGSNALITPASTQWQITVNSNPGGIASPLGTGAQSFTVTMTISGATQNISTTLNAVAPKLTNFIGTGTGSVSSVAGMAPIVVSPNPITGVGTVTCPTCNTSSATIAGSIASPQVAFGTAANTIGGDAQFTWDNANHGLSIGSANPSVPNFGNPGAGAVGLTVQTSTSSRVPVYFYGYGAASTPIYSGLTISYTTGVNNSWGWDTSAYVNPGVGQTVPTLSGLVGFDPSVVSSYGFAANTGVGIVTFATAFAGLSENLTTGTMTTAAGFVAQANVNNGGGVLTNSDGMYFQAQSQGTNNYGSYYEDFGTGANNWAQYEIGSNSKNRFPLIQTLSLQFNGSGSGNASISVAAAAGTPCAILLPTTSPTAGQVLSSAAPSGGNCQTSWIANGSGGSVTSFTGDGTIITNSLSTGVVTLTIAGTSGGIPYFSSSSGWTSSAALTHYGVVYGGGPAGAPVSTAADTTTTHALFATATAPAFRAIAAGDIPTLNQNTTGTAANLTGCTPSTAGSICYWNGSAWTLLAGNTGTTNWLQETSGGVPSWTAPAGGVSSVSGDGTIITNSLSTGVVTLTIAGTSGGIPYFSSSSGWTSSAALTHYGVVYGGGPAGAPVSTAADTTTTHALFATATAPAFRAIAAGDIPTLNQNTTGTAANLTGCTPSTAGSICYWNGSAWTLLAGNTGTTNWLQETSGGVPSWTTPSGSGTVNSGTQYAFAEYATAGTAVSSGPTPPSVNGNYLCGYSVTASAAVAPTCPLTGLTPDQAAGATVLYSDNNNVIYNPAAALALPTPTTLGNSNFYTTIFNNGAASTITPATWTISLNGGTAGATAVAGAHTKCSLVIDQVASTQWDLDCTDIEGYVNGVAVPASAAVIGTNSSKQTIAATGHGVVTPLNCSDSSGSGTAQSCTTAPSFTPAKGDAIIYYTTTQNSGALTLNVNSTSAAAVQKWEGTALASGDIKANVPVVATFDGTNWQVQTIGNPPASGGSVTSVTIAGTSNQITATGTCTVTTTGTCTLSLPATVNLGTDNSTAGQVQLSNGAANAHTIWASGATTSNTIAGFATAPTTTDLIICVVSSTTCTLTDSGIAVASNKIAISAIGTAGLSGTSPMAISAAGAISITANGITATQLAAQYSKGSCTEVWGGSGTSFAMQSGDDAVSNNSCYNDSGVTRTITALKCRSDNAANTTVLTPTFGAAGTGTAILTGTVTCGNSYAYSATGTLNNTAWTTGTGIDPGMSTVGNATSIAMIVEYTY